MSRLQGIDQSVERSWRETLRAFLHPRVVTMLFFGFSAGVPLLLIFSSLSLWLREAGVERSTVTFFSWAALGYSFKFIWAPLIDRLPLPLLTRRLGRRRAWILTAQLSIVVAVLWMGSVNPAGGEQALMMMAAAAVLLGFSSATQDIVIDAYRIESAPLDLQALMSSTYITGYRIGMLAAGAGALFMASALGSEKGSYDYSAWQLTYYAMAGLMLVGIATTLLIDEPEVNRSHEGEYDSRDYAGFLLLFLIAVSGFVASFWLSADWAERMKTTLADALDNKPLAGIAVEALRLALAIAVAAALARLMLWSGRVNRALVRDTWIDPIRDFFTRYSTRVALLLLLLVGTYRISDIVLGVITNVFFQDLGFTKPEIATIVKTFGLFMTIAGGFLGGVLAARHGVMRILFLGALLTVTTNLLFLLLAQAGHSIPLLYVVISADNLSAGLASAAFIAFLSGLTNTSFTAVQYAIFSSLMSLLPKMIGGYSGSMVDSIGYSNFFLFAALLGVPVLGLIWLANRWLLLREHPET